MIEGMPPSMPAPAGDLQQHFAAIRARQEVEQARSNLLDVLRGVVDQAWSEEVATLRARGVSVEDWPADETRLLALDTKGEKALTLGASILPGAGVDEVRGAVKGTAGVLMDEIKRRKADPLVFVKHAPAPFLKADDGVGIRGRVGLGASEIDRSAARIVQAADDADLARQECLTDEQLDASEKLARAHFEALKAEEESP